MHVCPGAQENFMLPKFIRTCKKKDKNMQKKELRTCMYWCYKSHINRKILTGYQTRIN